LRYISLSICRVTGVDASAADAGSDELEGDE
jgi:hypothetical protein